MGSRFKEVREKGRETRSERMRRIKEKLTGPLPTAIIFILILKFGGTLGGNPAVNYNNRIVKYQYAIIVKMLDLLNCLDKRNQEDMNIKLEALRLQIDNSLEKLFRMESFYGYTRLRDAAIELAKFYKSIASKEFKEMCKILNLKDHFFSQADNSRFKDIIKDIRDREAKYVYELHVAQKEFAQKYGVKFKLKKIQELDR